MSGLPALILTNVRRNFARTILTVVGMGMAALLMTSSLTLSQGYPAAAYEAYRDYLGGDILLYAQRVWVRGGDVSTAGSWSRVWQPPDVPGPAVFFQPGLATAGFLQGPGSLGYSAEQVQAISQALVERGLAAEVRPYLALPVGVCEFEAASPVGSGSGGQPPGSGAGASGTTVVWRDTYLRGWKTGAGWPALGKYVIAGRPFDGADQDRPVCLIDASRAKLSGLDGLEFPEGLPPLGGKVRVMLPRITLAASGRAAVDYLSPTWVELEVVGYYEVPTRTVSWAPEGAGGDSGASQVETEQLYLTSPEILVPWTTAERLLAGISGGQLSFWGHAISIEVDNLARVETTVAAIAALFPQLCPVSVPRQVAAANLHWLPEPVYRVPERIWAGAAPLGQVAEPVPISRAFNTIFFAIAALLAAANGMVLVLERGREIGILKALGAFRRDVILMVLGEIVLLASIGAAAGFGLAEGMAVWNLLSNRTPLLAVLAAVGADLARVFGFTVLFALVFGLLPALRTTSMTAMEVLRRE